MRRIEQGDERAARDLLWHSPYARLQTPIRIEQIERMKKAKNKDKKRAGKAAYTVTLTKAKVAGVKKRGADLSDLLDWLLARWLG
jgi:hypothetical protein